MRRLAALIGALLLIGGCARPDDPPAPPAAAAPAAPAAPADGSGPVAVAAWIAAGNPVSPNRFQTVIHNGVITTLGSDEVAFRLPGPLRPGTATGCIHRHGPALSCLPARLPGARVDFDGSMTSVSAAADDPGGFGNGPGRVLDYGDTLKFGDYQCRSDAAGLYCVNLPHDSGFRLSDTITAFGCVRQATPPYGIGAQFYCN